MFTDTRSRLIQIMSYCLDGWMCVCMLIAFYSANVNECSERYVTLVFLVSLQTDVALILFPFSCAKMTANK